MRLGVAWYPEQQPRERWAEDVRRMAEAGLELVRVGEFAWALLERERGLFEWGWLDEAIEVAEAAGLQVVLGTPTAAPPIWLCLERPEIVSVGSDGRRRAYGSRRIGCPTAPAFREESRRITGALSERYGHHPAVVAWQLDNEPGHRGSARCWCAHCEAAFQRWLEQRYGTVDALNRAWGTTFWGAVYPSFEAIRLPRPTIDSHSPSLLLAHRRFTSEQVLAALAEQQRIVSEMAPGRQILVNLPAHGTDVDQRAVARSCGVAAVNVYPTAHAMAEDGAFELDLAVGHTGRAWVMEHQPGPINWTPSADPVAPGQVRLWGWRAALHGVEALLFFSWRPARSGSEQYHAGLLRHDGSADRGLAEATRLAGELAAAPPALLRRPQPPLALLWSADDNWAIGNEPRRPGLTHLALVVAAHAAARRLGLELDVRAPEDDLRSYRAVLGPALHICTERRLERLRAAMDTGTLVVMGPRSLVKDEDDCWLEEALPGGMADELGASVVESHAGEARFTVAPYDAPVGPWLEVLELREPETEVLARYAGDTYLSGSAAAVRRANLVYAGFSSVEAWIGLLRLLLADHLELVDVPPTRERFRREGQVIELDHAAISVEGLPPGPAPAGPAPAGPAARWPRESG